MIPNANVHITTPQGGTSLGPNVVASGDVGPQTYACRAVGWYVVTAKGWTGYFIKTDVRPAADGSFRTPVLQLGSQAETNSSWFPFLIGASPAGCAWLTQLWAQAPTGEYHGAWPPPDSTVLYSSPAPVYRTS